MDIEGKKVVGVGVIIKTIDGKYLFHERDGHAKVAPNKVGFFAGGLEEGESEVTAVVRELKEELDLNINEESVEFVDYVEHLYDPSHVSAIFHIKDVDSSVLKLNEGKSIKEFESLLKFLECKDKTKLANSFISANLEKLQTL